MPTLYTTPLSANGRKPLAVVRHLGLAVEVETIDVYRGAGRAPEYLAVQPAGKIPALVDGDFTLWESNAILLYLAEAHGAGALWSDDARERADIARWLFWEASQWQPALIAVLAPFVGHALGLGPAAVVDWSSARLQALAQLADTHLAGRSFFVGERLTIADLSVAGMMTYARAAAFPWDSYPGLAAWYARIERLEGWRATAVETWA